MEKLNFTILLFLIILANDLTAQSVTYTFNGNGKWSDTANWVNHHLPPDVLPEGSEIIIDPADGGVCTLDTLQIITTNAKFSVRPQKKFIVKGNFNIIDTKNDEQWTVMSNPTDPLFAFAQTDTTQIEFYGDRDSQGIPSKLRLFIVKTTDTIICRIDDLGRPLIIQNTNGVRFKYAWKSATEADLTVTFKEIKDEVKTSIVLNSTGHKSSLFKSPINDGLTPDNITVNITNCGNVETSNIGDVFIQLQSIQGNQEISLIQTNFLSGKYTATLPQDVQASLIASSELCNNISNVISTACTLNSNGGEVMKATCLALSIALSFTPVTPVVASLFEAACLSSTAAFALYCKTINKIGIGNLICNAKFTKRIYNQGINLQPYIFYHGKKIMGDVLSTIGGSQQIGLNLEIKDCITLKTTSVSAITSTTSISGGNITSDGGFPITERGVCWSTSQNPTVGNNTIIDNIAAIGNFISNITDLTANKTYFVRAYAINSAGSIAYGNEVSFITSNLSIAGSTYTLISESGANVPGYVGATYEPGMDYIFDTENTFSVTHYSQTGPPYSGGGGYAYSLGQYSSDPLIIENLGVNLPAGYAISIQGQQGYGRLTVDKQYIYLSAAHLIFKLK